METNALKSVGNLLSRLRTTLVTEAEFEEVINTSIKNLALIGLEIQITVEENTTHLLNTVKRPAYNIQKRRPSRLHHLQSDFLGGPQRVSGYRILV